MLIKVLNKYDFNDLMISNGITKENVDDLKDTFIISINDSHDHYGKFESYFQDVKSDNVLVLHFDDSDENFIMKSKETGEKFSLKIMTEDQGKDIISFLTNVNSKLNKDTQLLIHCTAGQNRSGSVGLFAVDFFGYDMDRFNIENPIVKGNVIVTTILKRLWLWSHYI
tara:strand:- start:32456 stop:32959 length:504 start_codon:yes stop_codon:yes gene_type:complete